MTIHSRLSPRELNEALETLEKAEPNSAAVTAIGEATEAVQAVFRRHGFLAPGDDRCRNLETIVYWYFRQSNPELVTD